MTADLVIDADGHCNEPVDELAKWMPAEYARRAPANITDHAGQGYQLVEGRLAVAHGGLGPA